MFWDRVAQGDLQPKLALYLGFSWLYLFRAGIISM